MIWYMNLSNNFKVGDYIKKGVIMNKVWKKRCPFCYEKLEILEAVKRKIGRKCKCKKCNKIIDERFVKW